MYPSLNYARPGEKQFLFPTTGSDACLLRSLSDDSMLFLTSQHKFWAPDHVPECVPQSCGPQSVLEQLPNLECSPFCTPILFPRMS